MALENLKILAFPRAGTSGILRPPLNALVHIDPNIHFDDPAMYSKFNRFPKIGFDISL